MMVSIGRKIGLLVALLVMLYAAPTKVESAGDVFAGSRDPRIIRARTW
jgi:hypothetical protein